MCNANELSGRDTGASASPKHGADAPSVSASKYAEHREYVLWSRYETVAMHFNDLLMRLRTQALGGLTGLVAISGFAMNFTGRPATVEEWHVLFGAILFFTFSWAALMLLDLFYYDKLLAGAVNAILQHEESTGAKKKGDCKEARGSIILSTRIADRAGHHRKFVWIFYCAVLTPLLGGLVYTYNKFDEEPREPSEQIINLKILNDHIGIGVGEPASANATQKDSGMNPSGKAVQSE